MKFIGKIPKGSSMLVAKAFVVIVNGVVQKDRWNIMLASKE